MEQIKIPIPVKLVNGWTMFGFSWSLAKIMECIHKIWTTLIIHETMEIKMQRVQRPYWLKLLNILSF